MIRHLFKIFFSHTSFETRNQLISRHFEALLVVSFDNRFRDQTAWFYMDYAEQAKTENLVFSFTYFEYLKLKRKPQKVETTPETGADKLKKREC